MIHWVFTAFFAFIATNLDDIFILALLFSQTTPSFRRRHIVAGQYVGFAALVAVSLLGFLGSFIIPPTWIGLLGLVPVWIGIQQLLFQDTTTEKENGLPEESLYMPHSPSHAHLFKVAAITFANGGDNIGIYTPLFASSTSHQLGILLAVFFVLVGIWCWLGHFLTRQPVIGQAMSKYGQRALPFVLIGLGLFILWEGGMVSWLVGQVYGG